MLLLINFYMQACWLELVACCCAWRAVLYSYFWIDSGAGIGVTIVSLGKQHHLGAQGLQLSERKSVYVWKQFRTFSSFVHHASNLTYNWAFLFPVSWERGRYCRGIGFSKFAQRGFLSSDCYLRGFAAIQAGGPLFWVISMGLRTRDVYWLY